MTLTLTEEIRTAGNDACIAPIDKGLSSKWELLIMIDEIKFLHSMERKSCLEKQVKQIQIATECIEKNEYIDQSTNLMNKIIFLKTKSKKE